MNPPYRAPSGSIPPAVGARQRIAPRWLHPAGRPAAVCGALVGLLLFAAGGSAGGQTRHYRIVPESSALRVIVYREGVFSMLAHDHVLLARDLSGRVTLDSGDMGRSSVSMRVGVAGFEVDPPQERERAGFVSELTEGNRQSIREVMLGPEVLNAAAWPAITASSERIAGRLPDLSIGMRLKIRDKEQVLTIPVTVAVTAERLTASGRAEFKQSDFGIAPYRTLLGAIAVQDRIVVQFDLIAAPQP